MMFDDNLAKMEIRLSRKGVTEITGPLHDKAVCYEMLIEALRLVKNFKVPISLDKEIKPD